MTGAGLVLAVTTTGALAALQPFAPVTATLKVPDEATVIDCVVAPLDQAYEEPLDAVSVTLPPAQKVVGPLAEIVAAGAGFTVTCTGTETRTQLVDGLLTVTL